MLPWRNPRRSYRHGPGSKPPLPEEIFALDGNDAPAAIFGRVPQRTFEPFFCLNKGSKGAVSLVCFRRVLFPLGANNGFTAAYFGIPLA